MTIVPTQQSRSARTGILVLGMHRSGTSALTGVLSYLGATLPQNLMPSVENNNPTGFFESAKLRVLHDRMLVEAASRWDDWRAFDPSVLGPERLAFYKEETLRLLEEEYGVAPLPVLKDPRICRFVPFYEGVLALRGIEPRFIMPYRNPLAVIASLARRDGMTEGFAGLLWLRHVLDAEKNTRGKPRAFLSYEALLGDWRGAIDRVTKALDLAWPRGFEAAAEIDVHLSRDLQHHRPTFADLETKGEIPAWIKESYAALQTLAGTGGEGQEALATLTRVRREFDAAVPVFGRATFPELEARERKPSAGLRRLTGELRQRDVRIEELTAGKEALEAEQRRVVDELGQRDVRIEELTAGKEALEADQRCVAGKLRRWGVEIEVLTAQIAALETDLGALREILAVTGAKLAASETAVMDLRNQITEIHRSRSSRLTTPLRAGLRGLRAISKLAVGRPGFGTGQGHRPTPPHDRKEPQERTGSTDSLPGAVPGSERPATLHVTDDHITRARAAIEHAEVGRFSIVMPTWNRSQTLGRAIASVIAQSYEDWELIVCDDGSTDGTEEYVRERFASYLASGKIRYLRLEHRGVSAARNAGLRAAHGRWIAYLDSDNTWHPHYLLLTAAGYASARHRRTAYACVHVHDAAHQREFIRSQQFDWSRLLSRNFIDLNVFSHHRDLYEQLGGFDESLTRLVDWDLILRYTQLYEPQFNPFALCDYYVSRQLDNITLRESLEANETAVRRKFVSGSDCDSDTNSLMHLLTEMEKSIAVERLRDRSQDALVSVVMPTWNRAEQVAEAIRTVQAQSYENWELLIVDDGSTDATPEVVERLRSKDERVHYLAVAHGGVSAARDAGVRAARGELIAYLDSDNRWDPEYLLFMVNAVLDSGRMCAYAAVRVIDHEQGRNVTFRRRRFDYDALLKNNYIDINVFVHRVELFHELGGFDHELRRWVDWDVILRYVRKYTPEEVPVVLCDYHRQKKLNQITLEEPEAFKFKVLNKHLIDWKTLEAEVSRRKEGLVSIIIPVFNQLALTRKGLEAIERNTPEGEYEIVVVNNGSSDDTRSALPQLAKDFLGLRYVFNYENYMFALGNNIGVAHSKGEFIILLNNDTEVEPGWLEPLLEPLRRDPSIGIVGPKLLYPDNTLQCGGMVFGERSKIPYHIYRELPRRHPAVNKPREFQAVTGAAMALRAEDFIRLGGFDPIYVNGGEDLDFCFRMRHELGKRVFYNPASEIYHHEAKTPGRSNHIMHNRRVFVERWRDRIRVDDAHAYAEDGFEAIEYVKRGAEPHGETAAYVPELRELKNGTIVASGTRVRPDAASQRLDAAARPRPLNVGFSSMWYARGISFHTKQLAEALEGQDFTTHIFARWESDNFYNSGPIHHPRVFNAGDDPSPEAIVIWAREAKIGLMIFMEVHPNDWKRVEALKRAGVKVMCYENLDVLRLENWERYGMFDCFLFNTFYTREVMLGRFPGTPALMIPWGTVPPENIEPGGAVPGRPLRFVHVAGWGGINNRKNSDLLLRAFNRADDADAELHFFTQAPLANYGRVSERIAAINPHVHVHSGTLENIFQAYHSMDMLLWPSKREGLGLPIVEALASGLPVLVTDGWMMKEWIVPGEHGVLCPAIPEQGRTFLPEMQVDESELARLIGELAGHRERVQGMAKNVARDRDLWLWKWQPSVFREQLERLMTQPGYIPPETLDYLPETAKPPTCTPPQTQARTLGRLGLSF